ncbi:MAG: hypothetical protein ABJB76_03805 [Candidatus Nitrosocosmicus sp.]
MSKNSTEYSYNSNNTNNNNQNNNNQDFKESVNKSLDETKHNIHRSIDESKNQIPHYNTIVNNYQEQTLQIAKEISDEYIESQKSIINSLQSTWTPYNESYNGMVTTFASPDSMVKAYSRFVSNVADNAVSAMRLTNNMIFSNLDSWKSGLQQAKDNLKHIFNQNVNAAKTFEHNSKEVAAAVKDANSKDNTTASNNDNTTTTSSFSQQNNSKKI